MNEERLTELHPYRRIKLDNETCPYCAALLKDESTEDHVIGKKFVPTGKFHRSWNLVLMACSECNTQRKCALENYISAISMQPDAWGQFARNDNRLKSEASRKGSSQSPLTNRPVADSSESLSIKVSPTPGVSFTFDLNGPPQIDSPKVFELARMQLSAFFYWLSYDTTRGRGGFWPGQFVPVSFVYRPDWGNVTLVAFMNSVAEWNPRLLGIAADGFFKVAIRKQPDSTCWSWALEWNNNFRVVGFFGEEAAFSQALRSLPWPELSLVAEESSFHLLTRTEMSLPEKEDRLFS